MSVSVIGLLIAGLVLLVAGAESLVRGASRLALALGISPLVVGLTVVAFGTSAPEMAVSAAASLRDQADIALGNVVGSNIFNVLFILGVCALITPLVVNQKLVRLDVPLMIGISALVWVMAADGLLSRPESLLLFLGIIAYTVFLIWESRSESKAIQQEYADEYDAPTPQTPQEWLLNIGLVIGGLAVLVLGSRWLVTSAIAIAEWAGLSELIIGLTIVAAGTSLPEVATSVIASLRGERDIAVGNVIGSNIFNLLAVLGVAGMLSSGGIEVGPQLLSFDMWVMLAVAIACLPIFFTGHLIARWEGLLFLGYYVAYVLYLILATQQHASLPLFRNVMSTFVGPLTVITLAILFVRSWRARHPAVTSGS